MIFIFLLGVLIGILLMFARLLDEKNVNEKLKKVINNIEDENTEIARINQRLKYENEILNQIKNIVNNNGTIVEKFDKIKELVEKL